MKITITEIRKAFKTNSLEEVTCEVELLYADNTHIVVKRDAWAGAYGFSDTKGRTWRWFDFLSDVAMEMTEYGTKEYNILLDKMEEKDEIDPLLDEDEIEAMDLEDQFDYLMDDIAPCDYHGICAGPEGCSNYPKCHGWVK